MSGGSELGAYRYFGVPVTCDSCGSYETHETGRVERETDGVAWTVPIVGCRECGQETAIDERDTYIETGEEIVTDGGSESETHHVLEKLRGGEVALKLTHGEGEGYFAFVDGELHHHRAHPSVPSAGAGEDARERFDLDWGFMAMFEPEYIPLDESPFAEVN